MCLIIIELLNYVTEEKESLVQVNENLSKKLQELEARLTDTNNELKKTKEALKTAEKTIAQYKEENVSLEDRLSKCHREHVLQAVSSATSRQKDVMIIFLLIANFIFYQFNILFIYFL